MLLRGRKSIPKESAREVARGCLWEERNGTGKRGNHCFDLINLIDLVDSLNYVLYKVETVSDFILGGSKITADGDCSHEIKRRLLLGRKVMTNLDSIFKSRDITLPTKVHLVKAMVFPAVYGCESWTVKKLSAKELMHLNCGVGEDS